MVSLFAEILESLLPSIDGVLSLTVARGEIADRAPAAGCVAGAEGC